MTALWHLLRLLPLLLLLLLLQVLDRVLLQSGGRSWWGALIGRVKLQRGLQQRHTTTLVRLVTSRQGP
jgi:hypothetical protein